MAKNKREKTIRHMGMTMTDKEHEQWHREHKDLTPEEHEQLMKHMGISPEEDRKWHQDQKRAGSQTSNSRTGPLNPFLIGGGFLTYCVKQGWLIQEGKGNKTKYFATEKGRRELAKFDIRI